MSAASLGLLRYAIFTVAVGTRLPGHALGSDATPRFGTPSGVSSAPSASLSVCANVLLVLDGYVTSDPRLWRCVDVFARMLTTSTAW